MHTIRRLSAAIVAPLVLGAFLVNPAQAETQTTVTSPEVYVATASARALQIDLLGLRLTFGSSGALVSVTPTGPSAKADGAGALLVAGTVAHAEVNAANASQAPPPACVLNLPLGLINASAACGTAKAETPNGVPAALGTGNVAAIELNLSLLDPLVDQLEALLGQTIGTVTGTLDALLGGLLTPLLGTLDLDLTDLVDELIAGLQRATGVLSIRLGDSVSGAAAGPNAVVGNAASRGAQIDVLPGLALSGAPLISIVVGEANATATFDRNAGTSSATFNPAVATVRLGLPLLGGTLTEIPVRLGAPINLLEGTPLASTISLGAGRVVQNPDGSVASFADGVSLRLLAGLNGGIGIELAHAEAGAAGRKAVLTTQELPKPPVEVKVQPERLARTGGTAPWLPLAGAAMLMVAFYSRRLLLARR